MKIERPPSTSQKAVRIRFPAIKQNKQNHNKMKNQNQAAMKALVCSFHQPLHCSKPSPRNQINRIKITNNLNISTTKSRGRIQPNAKGFPGNSPARNREPAVPGRTNGGGSDDDEIPEAVSKRIVTRILTSVGVPLALGVTLLKILEAVKGNGVWEVPIWVPFLTTFLTFGASALGIAYGALSACLDPEEEGSLFGWEQVEKNWVEMWKEEDEANR